MINPIYETNCLFVVKYVYISVKTLWIDSNRDKRLFCWCLFWLYIIVFNFYDQVKLYAYFNVIVVFINFMIINFPFIFYSIECNWRELFSIATIETYHYLKKKNQSQCSFFNINLLSLHICTKCNINLVIGIIRNETYHK